MAAVKELAYVVYEVSDLADWERFSVDLMGLQIGQKTDDCLTLRNDDKSQRWILTQGPADDLAASGYEVESNVFLDKIIAQLQADGLTVTEGDAALAQARQVDRIVFTTDPMGNRIELVTGLANADTPFHSDVLTSAFLTGACGSGHQVVLTKDVSQDDYMHFYVDLLGFKISDRIVEELAPGLVADFMFLHCNPRHHTLALGDLPHPKRTHHFMLQVTDILDVGWAWQRCLEAGQPLEMTLGGHPNDRMFSFYVKTPSGFAIEYGYGGLLIENEATWQVRTYDKLDIWGHFPPGQELDWLSRARAK
jgi:2,3-dihydroxybiphenyl 1,2-dioxygenase